MAIIDLNLVWLAVAAILALLALPLALPEFDLVSDGGEGVG